MSGIRRPADYEDNHGVTRGGAGAGGEAGQAGTARAFLHTLIVVVNARYLRQPRILIYSDMLP